MALKEIDISTLNFNPFTLIDDSWFLITAGNEKAYNTMTASWGHMGNIWGKKRYTFNAYVRPQRYTKKFMDSNEFYTICFFDKKYQKDLAYLGSHSGKDEDKVKKTYLSPIHTEDYTYFKEAKYVFICKKIYQAPIKEEYFKDEKVLEEAYPLRDFHDMYVGEIIKVLADE